MTFLQSIARISALAAAVALSSCIDSREEFWLAADGSGRAEFECAVPAAAARGHGGEPAIREMIARFLKETPEITTSSFEVLTRENRLHVKLHVAFDSALDLRDVAAGPSLKRLPSAASHLAGEITTNIHGRTLDFTRKISPAKALPGSAFIPDSQLHGHRLVYIIHLPAAPAESNATRVEDSGHTLIWDKSLKQALESPIVTRFKMDIPIPWKLVAMIAVPLSLVCGLAFLKIRKSRKSPEIAASIEPLIQGRAKRVRPCP